MPFLRIFLALWLAITPAFAWAGSMTLLGVGSSASAPSSLALDGNAIGTNSGTVSSVAPVLTTTQANDVIIVLVTVSSGSVASVTSPHLTFMHRATASFFSTVFAYEYYAIAASPLTSETITVAFTSTGIDPMANAFGISGANTASPFDPNGALPGIVGTGGAGGSYPTITTSNANTFDFGITLFGSTTTPTAGAGWTLLQHIDNAMSAYQINSTTQSGLQFTSGNGPGSDVAVGIADAVTK